jgi:hypothetical protein
MPTPTDDLAGLSDAELDRRAALATGWREALSYWVRAKGESLLWKRDWHPSTDRNDAHRLVEECGWRGLKYQFGVAIAEILGGAPINRRAYWSAVEPADYYDVASATPRQITEAAVSVLAGETVVIRPNHKEIHSDERPS